MSWIWVIVNVLCQNRIISCVNKLDLDEYLIDTKCLKSLQQKIKLRAARTINIASLFYSADQPTSNHTLLNYFHTPVLILIRDNQPVR